MCCKEAFCEKILKNFCLFFPALEEASPKRVLLAVSGGADSVAMLCSLFELNSKLSCNFSVVTVNHHIRSVEENLHDVNFVVELCNKLDVPCYVEDIKGISEYSKQNKCGIEAAARDLRYECFERIANNIGAEFIATAHTQDDFYETVLMRVFQGGTGKSLLGIPARRGKYIRPLLNVSRHEIISYLKSRNIEYCNDSTNSLPDYLRNRIRLFLIPALEETFPNWKSGIDKTIENVKLDFDFAENELLKKLLSQNPGKDYDLNTALSNAFVKTEDCLKFSSELFFSLDKALKLRVLLKGFNLLGFKMRLSHSFLKQAIQIKTNQKIESGNLGVFSNTEYLTIYKTSPSDNYKIGYSLWVEKKGVFEYPLGIIQVISASNTDKGLVYISDANNSCGLFGPFRLPFYIRSVRNGDRIEIEQGKFKTVKKLINEFKLNSRNRVLLPIIERNGIVFGIYGASVGGKNRIKFSDS
ncbi:MAG: tRNA lysidine(34) synthetase TilS [Treponema sp.]|nr:MAG: tRNA lysidine(34) synthetase TilS [Treponema sp.]